MLRAPGEGSFAGHPGRYVKKGSGYGHLSPSEVEPGIRMGGALIYWGL